MAALTTRARGRWWRRVAALLTVQASITLPGSAGENLEMAEQKIKAGLIYNLLKYVEWPESQSGGPSSTATVCIFGEDPFDGSLAPLAGRTVNRREIALRLVDDIGATANCQLVFVTARERSRWPQLSAFLAGKSVLTVADFDEFVGSGGMIELGRQNEHIKVSMDARALAAAGLHVQDRLRKLAHVVDSAGR